MLQFLKHSLQFSAAVIAHVPSSMLLTVLSFDCGFRSDSGGGKSKKLQDLQAKTDNANLCCNFICHNIIFHKEAMVPLTIAYDFLASKCFI